MAKKTSTKPSGLGITRQGGVKFLCSWKIPSGGYGAGQQFQFRIWHSSKANSTANDTSDWYDVEIGNATTSKTINNKVYEFVGGKKKVAWEVWLNPNGDDTPYFVKLAFRVRGCRAKDKKHSYKWSEWAKYEVTIAAPPKPTITVAPDDNVYDLCTFSWSASTSDSTLNIASKTQYQSMIFRDLEAANNSATVVNAFNSASFSSANANRLIPGRSYGYVSYGTVGLSGSLPRKENNLFWEKPDYSWTRVTRVRTLGPRGQSEWAYASHVYSRSYLATSVSAEIKENKADGTTVVVKWIGTSDYRHPIDHTVVQYAMDTPINKKLEPSSGISWTDGGTYLDTGDWDSASFAIDAQLGYDQCFYVRVNNVHDKRSILDTTQFGIPVRVTKGGTGNLKNPESVTAQLNDDGKTARVAATNASDTREFGFLAVYWRTTKNKDPKIIGIIERIDSFVDVILPSFDPEDMPDFGVQAYVGDYTQSADGYYTISSDMMHGDGILWSGKLPKPPSNVVVNQLPTSSSIAEISWDKSWNESNGTEISWADHEDAWKSTDEPSTYDVPTYKGNAWHVSGLSPTKYWFRLRNYFVDGDETTYGPYSFTKTLKLSAEPAIPHVTLSDSIIPEDGSVTCYWAYISNDGTPQAAAKIADANYVLTDDETITSGKTYYALDPVTSVYKRVTPTGTEKPDESKWYEIIYKTIASVTTSYSQTLYANQQNPPWKAGEVHHLCVRLTSGSGEESVEWSEPAKITIANKPRVEITNHSLELNKKVGVDADGDDIIMPYVLTTLPLILTVDGDAMNDTISVRIERDGDYDLIRPDDSKAIGRDGEIIAQTEAKVREEFNIERSALVGQLDDGAKYKIVATVKDQYGQINWVEQPFYVYWDHQAQIPSGVIDVESQLAKEHNVAFITPICDEAQTVSQYVLTTDHERVVDKTYYIRNDETNSYTPAIDTIGYEYSTDETYNTSKTYYLRYGDSYAVYEIGSTENDNPSAKGWLKHVPDETGIYSFVAATETSVIANTAYYWNYPIETGGVITYPSVIFDDKQISPQGIMLYELASVDPAEHKWYEAVMVDDCCDIYRLSADAPELIVENAKFGVKYVDKYPAIGRFGGHRIVYKTANGDYITKDNEIAFAEFDADDGDILDIWDLIIDWDGKSVSLPYNVSLDNSWSKDFTETKYLGGSVTGDWNPAISRTTSVSTVGLVSLEPETISLVRELANYPGVCHVRTPDGSSYYADVQISENREEQMINQLASYSLSITRVDPEEPDGLTYEKWLEEIQAEEE